jgi:CheY-like chemotaxis protein
MQLSNCTILIVDDEPPILRMLGRVLGTVGCELVMAGDAEEALELATDHRPDVVISDIRLPRMSGVELTEEIRRRLPDARVLLISAYREPAEHSADAFLAKPFDNDELLERVEDLVSAI